MNARNLYSEPLNNSFEEIVIVSKKQLPPEPEWIRTSEAMDILGVSSTEGVLHIVRGDRDNPNWIVRHWNVGTEQMPRYMLAKEDIEKLAEDRRKLE